MSTYLFDSNIFVGVITGNAPIINAYEKYASDVANSRVFTSAICHGELLALAEKRGWGEKKRGRLTRMLLDVPALDINSTEVLRAYSLISAWTEGRFVAAPRQTPPPRPAIRMKQNDMWIAATAYAYDATLVTADKDFIHCADVWFPLRLVKQS